MIDLSDRERQVVALIAEGKTSKEIARALGIAFRTVISHRLRISKKIAANNAADFNPLVNRIGLVPVTDNNATELGIERRAEEIDHLDRRESETSGTEMLSLESCDLRESLDQAKLRFDFAYSFLREVHSDGVKGPDYDEALDTAVRSIAAALSEYSSLLELYIGSIQEMNHPSSLARQSEPTKRDSVGLDRLIRRAASCSPRCQPD